MLKRLGLGVAALLHVNFRQVVETLAHGWRLRAQDLLPNCQGSPDKR